MKINVDRLCQLAGVERDSSEVLSEASNRSYHDGDNSDEVEFRYGGAGQLAEGDDPAEDESDSVKMLRKFIEDAKSKPASEINPVVLDAAKAALGILNDPPPPGPTTKNEVAGEMEEDMEEGYYEEADHAHEAVYETMEEMGASDDPMEEMEDSMEEMIEVDEVELVQELRRARKMIAEAKEKKQSLQESELKSIIESEIANVMKDLNLTAGWVYGDKKPKAVKRGYVHQGSFLKGIGFE